MMYANKVNQQRPRINFVLTAKEKIVVRYGLSLFLCVCKPFRKIVYSPIGKRMTFDFRALN